jgi:hypothetical protein
MKRWSARHVVADSLVVIPALFFALLFVPPIPLWVAACIALVVGTVVVPLTVRRRRSLLLQR